jgi:hypothetical protein
MAERATPAYITSLIRHFEDLRDGTHGGSASRKDKEAHFEKAVQMLTPVARQVLTEINTSLLLDTGQLTETGLRRTGDGGLMASWVLVGLNSRQPESSRSRSTRISEVAFTILIFEERQFMTGH